MTTPTNDPMNFTVEQFAASQLYARERNILISMMGTDPSSTTLNPNRIKDQMHRTLAALRDNLSLRAKPTPAEEASPLSDIPADVQKAFAAYYVAKQEANKESRANIEAQEALSASVTSQTDAAKREYAAHRAMNEAIAEEASPLSDIPADVQKAFAAYYVAKQEANKESRANIEAQEALSASVTSQTDAAKREYAAHRAMNEAINSAK